MGACELRHFDRPCLLLLLRQQPDHGYDLVARLREFGLEPHDAGTVYRTLRALESEGLVTSVWVPPQSGPARRIYQLTPVGERALAAEVRDLTATLSTMDRFLRTYAHGGQSHPGHNGNGRVDPLLGPHARMREPRPAPARGPKEAR